jgi:hypothetical protein
MEDIKTEYLYNEKLKHICYVCKSHCENELITKICDSCQVQLLTPIVRREIRDRDDSEGRILKKVTTQEILPTLEEFQIILKREANEKQFDAKIMQVALQLNERFIKYKQSLQIADAAQFALDSTMDQDDQLSNEFRVFWNNQLHESRLAKNASDTSFIDIHTWSEKEMIQLKLYLEQYELK